MERTIPTFVVFISSRIYKLKEIILFPKIEKDNCLWLPNKNGPGAINFSRSFLSTIVLLFFVSFVNAATITSTGSGGLWSSPSTWIGGVVPTAADDVIVASGSSVILDVNISIGSGITYTFNGNVTDNGTHTLTNSVATGTLIISNNSTTTIGGVVSIDQMTITVNSGSKLITGAMSISGSGSSTVTINGALIINGDFTVKKGTINVSGYVFVNGNYATENANANVTGTGSFDTSGSITTQGSSQVFGSGGDCAGPGCSGTSLGCSATNSITPSNQVLCSGNTSSQPITFSTTSASYSITRWEKTTDLVTFTPIAFTGSILPSQTVTQDTWFRVVFTSTSPNCGSLNSAAAFVRVSSSTPTISGILSICIGSTTTLTGSATANATTPWSSATPTVATVNNGGVVTAVTAGTSAISYKNSYGCVQMATVTVTPTVGTPSTPTPSASAICQGSSNTTYTTSATNANSYTWSVTGAGNTISGTGTTGTVTWAASFSGTATISVTATGCGTSSAATTTVTVNPLLSIPTINMTTQPNCLTGTGSVLLNNLPTSGTWSLYQDNVDIYDATGGSGSVTISALAAAGSGTTYNFKVSNGVCTSAVVSVTVNPVLSTKWIGGLWDNGEPNTSNSNKNIVFEDNYTLTNDLVGCSCEIKANVSVTVATGKVLKMQNGLAVQGNLIFENGASLVQDNDLATNSGSITYKRTTSTVNDYDYVYWSSPVIGRTLGQLSPTSDKYWSWLVDNWTPAKATDVMLPAKGYIVRVPLGTSPQNVVFLGTPNNGVKTIASQGVNKSNLIGNPYPSALDADLFMIYNKTIIDGALYFWTHTKPRVYDGASNQYVYAANDYAVYTLLGGTGSGSGSAAPTKNIAAGQSFFVVSKRSGNFTFNNSMRVSTAGNNSQFLKQAITKKGIAAESDRVWLSLTNDGGAFKQLLVGYMAEATNDFDNLYDGITLDGNSFVDFYSIANTKKYTIQGRSLPFNVADEVPLGYKTTIAGTFTIAIDKVDGGMSDQEIYLEDKTTNKIQNLKIGSYSFTTAIGTFTDRFVLRYTDISKTLRTDDAQTKGKGVIVSVKNGQIKINSFDQTLSSLKVYDLNGSLLYEKNKVNKNEFVIDDLVSSDQFMIVMAQLEDGKWVSEEIIFHE
ncbi:beta strand repeat-containing protein [Flavobacterium sp. WC2509]|uniref:beta strand repeat-containing protein n=1 Tax=Flavobacterium sp. WC2509 TaxID=3461406 RepID=UPI004043A015